MTSRENFLLNMASSNSQINKPQRGRPKRTELSDVNINTHAQSINTEKGSLRIFSRDFLGLLLLLSRNLEKLYATSGRSLALGLHLIRPSNFFVLLQN